MLSFVGVKILVAPLTQTVLQGMRILEFTDLATDIAAGTLLVKNLPSFVKKALIASLVISSILFVVQGLIKERDSRRRKIKRFLSIVSMFFEDAIMIPINLFAVVRNVPIPLSLNFRDMGELTILLLGVVVGGAVVIAKIITLVYETLWLEEIYQGDFTALKTFLRDENGPQPWFLLSNFLWRVCVKRH